MNFVFYRCLYADEATRLHENPQNCQYFHMLIGYICVIVRITNNRAACALNRKGVYSKMSKLTDRNLPQVLKMNAGGMAKDAQDWAVRRS